MNRGKTYWSGRHAVTCGRTATCFVKCILCRDFVNNRTLICMGHDCDQVTVTMAMDMLFLWNHQRLHVLLGPVQTFRCCTRVQNRVARHAEGEMLRHEVVNTSCCLSNSNHAMQLLASRISKNVSSMSATNISARNTTSACTEHRGHRGERARPHGKLPAVGC